MFCPHCGARNDESSHFCLKCGRALVQVPDTDRVLGTRGAGRGVRARILAPAVGVGFGALGLAFVVLSLVRGRTPGAILGGLASTLKVATKTAVATHNAAGPTNLPAAFETVNPALTLKLSPSLTQVPTSTSTPTRRPMLTPLPTNSPSPTARPEPTCAQQPGPTFLRLWGERQDLRENLGCPVQEVRGGFMAEQSFERGHMIWREADRNVFILYDEGSWRSVPDRWQEGMPEYSCEASPPPDLWQPKRGFGLVWCNESGVRDRLGWAYAEERGYTNQWQVFERGEMLVSNARSAIVAWLVDGSFSFYPLQ